MGVPFDGQLLNCSTHIAKHNFIVAFRELEEKLVKRRGEQKGRGGGQIRREKTVLCEDKYPKEDVRPIADDVVHGDSTASME